MKTFILNLLLVSSLFAGTYDDAYSPLETQASEKKDPFMYGDFLEIVRFDALSFEDGTLESGSTQNLDTMIEKIQTYIKDEKNITLKVIGHGSEATDDHNEQVVDSDTYANAIQNWFRHSMTTEQTTENSKNYALNIAQKLVDNNISKDILVVEHRGTKDLGYTSATDEGRDLSNRVMVTMYVSQPIDKDSDGDGVLDSKDKCPDTPHGVAVDKDGCPLDSDKDGVVDYLDECPDTPLNVPVDAKGCPFDTDKDGVLDYKDKCPGTPTGLTVDADGCPISMVLRLNFKTDSAEILPSSDAIVLKFANFMNENRAYQATITGHTDSVGKAGYNMILSKDRAIAVATALVNHGVNATRLESVGRGELSPIETNRTSEGRAKNRRIEVNLYH